MYQCKVCNKTFIKKYRRYKNYCSENCYQKFWRLNPENKKKANRYGWATDRYEKGYSCIICGFNRAIDFAHIRWIKDGGKENKLNLTILCPNHHRLYDKGLLTKDEREKIKPVIEILQRK